MKQVCLIIFLIIIFFPSAAQKKQYTGAGSVAEFIMPAEAKIVGHFDLFYEAKIPNSKGESRSFWYKIVFRQDCFFKFSLFPLFESDRYDFKMFHVEGDVNFCKAAAAQKVYPVMDVKTKKVWHDSEQTRGFRDNLLFTKQVQVKKGDAIYIEVINLWGNDLGHIIDLNTCDYNYVLKAIKENPLPNKVDSASMKRITREMEDDFLNAMERVKNTICPVNGVAVKLSSISFGDIVEVKNNISVNGEILNAPQKLKEVLAAEKKNPGNILTLKRDTSLVLKNPAIAEVKPVQLVKIKCIVQNTKTNLGVDAKPKVIDELKGEEINLKSLGKEGEFEMTLEPGRNYKVTCSSLGFKNVSGTFNFGSDGKVFQVKMEPLVTGENIVLHSIQFHPNTPVIKTDSRPELENLYKFLKKNPGTVIEISGHTNGNRYIKPDNNKFSLGDEWSFKGSSKKLSLCRAEQVKEYLVKKGIDEKRLKTKGFGGDKALYPEAKNQEEISKNIRVEILVLKT